MKLDRPVTAILFDLGNTLWPDIWSASGEHLATLANRRVDEFLVSRGLEIPGAPAGVGERIRSAALASYQLAGSTDRGSPRLDLVCRDVVRQLGLALNLAQCNALLDCINLEGPDSGRSLFEDALPVLETLHARGFKMGIVSNRLFAGERFAETLRHLGLTPFFQTVRTSCDFGFLKPHPRIFKVALRDLGVTPRQAVMVGDSLDADIEGARVLGLRTIWRRNGDQSPGAARPGWTIEKLSDLLTISALQESRAQ